MTILIVHLGTGTVIDASDDVLLIDTKELTEDECLELEEYENVDVLDGKGTDIMKIIRAYIGDKKSKPKKKGKK
jgi:hypothetical protein